MFGFFSKILGNIVTGVCLSVIGMIALNLVMMLRGAPRAVSGLWGLVRQVLRISFMLYAALFSRIGNWLYHQTGIDLSQPVPRTIAAGVLSVGVPSTALLLFGYSVKDWMLIVLLLHGLFVGLAWEHILTPDDFQLGSRIE